MLIDELDTLSFVAVLKNEVMTLSTTTHLKTICPEYPLANRNERALDVVNGFG